MERHHRCDVTDFGRDGTDAWKLHPHDVIAWCERVMSRHLVTPLALRHASGFEVVLGGRSLAGSRCGLGF